MITSGSTMRIPCSRCGQLNNVERAAEVTFRCTACDSANTVRTLAAAGTPAPVAQTRREPRWRTAGSGGRPPAGRPAGKSGAERSGAMSRAKQVLVGLMVMAAVGALVHPGGTFATFNATTTNAANITTGVLLLGNKLGAASECFSSGAATISSTNSNSCNAVWPVAVNKPNDSFLAHLAIRNPGNIAASILQLYATVGTCDSAPGVLDATSGLTFKGQTQATATTLTALSAIGATSLQVAASGSGTTGFVVGGVVQVDTGANLEQLTISAIPDATHLTVNAAAKAHANGVAVNGGGLCRQAQIVVAKTDATYEASNTGSCLYGKAAAGSPMTGTLQCGYDTLHNLRDFNDNYALGGVNPGPISIAGGIGAGVTQNYLVAINFPNGSDNGYQGLATAVTFTWFAQQ